MEQSSRRKKYVFFDVGGTILDLSSCYLGVIKAWKHLGIKAQTSPADLTQRWADISQDFIATKEAKGGRGIFQTTCDAMFAAMVQLGIQGDHSVAQELTEEAWRAVRKGAKPFPDASPSVFLELRSLGYLMGIITDGDSEVVNDLLPKIPCLELFQPIVCSWEVGATKPDARPFLRALKLSGCSPGDGVFVGDAPADVSGAKAVGMLSVMIDRSGTYAGRPVPDLSVKSLTELPHALSRAYL